MIPTSKELACGPFGVSVLDSTNAMFCKCDPGWSQSVEFAFFIPNRKDIAEDQAKLLKLPCDNNVAFLRVLFAGILILSVLSIVAHFAFLKTKRQLFRLLPTISYFLLLLVVAIIKLADEDKLFGVDIGQTVLTSFTFFNALLTGVVFFNKYITYQEKIFKVSTDKVRNQIKRFKRLRRVIVTIDVVSVTLLLSTVFADEGALILFKAALVIGIFRSFYDMYCAIVLIKLLLDSMDILVDDIHEKVRKSMKRVRFILLLLSVITIFFYLTALISNEGMVAWKYILPILAILHLTMTLLVLFSYQEQVLRTRFEVIASKVFGISLLNSTTSKISTATDQKNYTQRSHVTRIKRSISGVTK